MRSLHVLLCRDNHPCVLKRLPHPLHSYTMEGEAKLAFVTTTSVPSWKGGVMRCAVTREGMREAMRGSDEGKRGRMYFKQLASAGKARGVSVTS